MLGLNCGKCRITNCPNRDTEACRNGNRKSEWEVTGRVLMVHWREEDQEEEEVQQQNKVTNRQNNGRSNRSSHTNNVSRKDAIGNVRMNARRIKVNGMVVVRTTNVCTPGWVS